jgi:hypothetical protein
MNNVTQLRLCSLLCLFYHVIGIESLKQLQERIYSLKVDNLITH